jgi:DNA-binding transcriptional MerR regulator
MKGRRTPGGAPSIMLRVGEVAKLTELTTRTSLYWEEVGLVSPTWRGPNGERLYSSTDMAWVSRIRDLQELLGSPRAEVHAWSSTPRTSTCSTGSGQKMRSYRVETERLLRGWVGGGHFPDHPWREPLQRSALTLKGLTYAPHRGAARGSDHLVARASWCTSKPLPPVHTAIRRRAP